MTGVIIADGHPEVRAALRLVLAQQPEWQVTAEAASRTELLEAAARGCPDLVLMDIDLNGLPGAHDEKARRPVADMVAALNRLCPGVRVVLMSSLPEARAEAVAARADGFLCKSDPPDRLRGMLEEFTIRSNRI